MKTPCLMTKHSMNASHYYCHHYHGMSYSVHHWVVMETKLDSVQSTWQCSAEGVKQKSSSWYTCFLFCHFYALSSSVTSMRFHVLILQKAEKSQHCKLVEFFKIYMSKWCYYFLKSLFQIRLFVRQIAPFPLPDQLERPGQVRACSF